MPVFAAIAAASGGGRIIPDKPTISRPSAGTFVITNYNSQFIYTRSDGVPVTSATVVLSNTTSSATITVASQKGMTAQTYVERAPYTYSCRQVSYSCSCNCSAQCNGYCKNDGPCPPGVGQGYQECGCSAYFCGTISIVCQTCTCCCNTVCDVLNDRTGEGYSSTNGEWTKVI